MRGGFRGGRSYHPGNRPTLSPPPPPETTRLISTVEAAERERSRVSIVCSINRWKWHEMRRLTPAQSSHLATRLVYRRVCIVNCPRVFSLPPVARSSCLQRQRGEDPGLILEDHRRRWFSASSSRKWEMHSLVERRIINFLTGNLGCGYGYGYREVIFFWT